MIEVQELCKLLEQEDSTTLTRLKWLRTMWPALADRLCDVLLSKGQPIPKVLVQ